MPTPRDQKCALLRKNLCFENFFETLCVDRDQTAAIWLENDREQSYNYEEFHARALQTAARIDDARLGRRDGWDGPVPGNLRGLAHPVLGSAGGGAESLCCWTPPSAMRD